MHDQDQQRGGTGGYDADGDADRHRSERPVGELRSPERSGSFGAGDAAAAPGSPMAGNGHIHPGPAGDAGDRLPPTRGSASLRYGISGAIICLLAVVFASLAHMSSSMQGTDPLPNVSEASSFQLRYLGRVSVGMESLEDMRGAGGGGSGGAGSPLTAAMGDIQQQVEDLLSGPIESLRGAAVLFELGDAAAARDLLELARNQLSEYRAAAAGEHDAWADRFGNEPMLTEADVALIGARASDAHRWIDRLEADAEDMERLIAWGEAAGFGSGGAGAGVGVSADVPIPPDRADELRERHSWFADAALTWGLPDDAAARRSFEQPARRMLIVVLSMMGAALLAIFSGFVLAIVAIVLLATRRIRPRFNWQPGLSAAQRGALLESVAVFLVGFAGLSILLALAQTAGVTHPALTQVMWLLLLAAAWPLLRGVTGPQLRLALGWHANGKGVLGVFKEIGLGVVGYLVGLPIVIGALAVSLLLVVMSNASPTHPITDRAADTSTLGVLLLYLLAAGWAPIVEETIFRGAFYASLRPKLVPVAAGFVNAFIFAIIHPQGWALAPVLASLGFVFSMVREWRGSLIGPITAHALHNGFIVTLLVTIMA
jgi:membrane protease YdiL (CAAX protease family)